MFDKDSNSGWLCTGGVRGDPNQYNKSTGLYEGSNVTLISELNSNVAGEWGQLQLPQNIFLTDYSITANTGWGRSPKDFTLLGSTDGVRWTRLDRRTNVGWNSSFQASNFVLSNQSVPYNYFRIVAEKIMAGPSQGFNPYMAINEWKLFGYTNPQVAYTVPLEYPPHPMSSNTHTFSGLGYGNGTYSAIGGNRDPAFQMFDNVSSSSANYYMGFYGGFPTASNGDYYGTTFTTMSGSNYYGSIFPVTLPNLIVPTSYYVKASSDICKSITQWVLGGSSNAGASWTLLDFAPQSNIVSFQTRTKTLNTDKAYNMYRIVAMTTGNTTCGVNVRDIPNVGEWRMYGLPSFPTAQPERMGQTNLSSEIVNVDTTLFKRHFSIELTSPSGVDLSTMGNWSAHISFTTDPVLY